MLFQDQNHFKLTSLFVVLMKNSEAPLYSSSLSPKAREVTYSDKHEQFEKERRFSGRCFTHTHCVCSDDVFLLSLVESPDAFDCDVV